MNSRTYNIKSIDNPITIVELKHLGSLSDISSPPGSPLTTKKRNPLIDRLKPSNDGKKMSIDSEDIDMDSEPPLNRDDNIRKETEFINPLGGRAIDIESLHINKYEKCLARPFLCCSIGQCLFPWYRSNSKLFKITCPVAWMLGIIWTCFFFTYLAIGLDYYQLISCKADNQTCYTIVRAEPNTLSPPNDIIPFIIEMNMIIPTKHGVQIGSITGAKFQTGTPSTSFGSLDIGVSFLYPDNTTHGIMHGFGATPFKCFINGHFTVLDEKTTAYVFSQMLNDQYFDITVNMSIPITLDGFWPFVLTYNLQFGFDYRCEKGFVDGISFCWLPPVGVSQTQYDAAKLAAYQLAQAETAAWQKINNAKTSTIESINISGFNASTASSASSSAFQSVAIDAVMSINMLGSFMKAAIPAMYANVYMSSSPLDPFSTSSPNLNPANEPVITLTINPFEFVGLRNGGPFNVTALATIISPVDSFRVATLQQMIGLYLNQQNIYLYVQGSSDPINDSSLVRRIFSLMPPWRIQLNNTASVQPNINFLATGNGDLGSYCKQQTANSFQLQSFEFLGLNNNVFSVLTTASYPLQYQIGGFVPPIGFIVTIGATNHTVIKVATRSFQLYPGNPLFNVIVDVTLIDGDYVINALQNITTIYDLLLTVKGDPSINIVSSLLSTFQYTLKAPAASDICAAYYTSIAVHPPKQFGLEVLTASTSSFVNLELLLSYYGWSQSFHVISPYISFSIGLPSNGIVNGATATTLITVTLNPFDLCSTGCSNQINVTLALSATDQAAKIQAFISAVTLQQYTPLVFKNSIVNDGITSRSKQIIFSQTPNTGSFNTLWGNFSNSVNAALGTGTYSSVSHTPTSNPSSGFYVHRRSLKVTKESISKLFSSRNTASTNTQGTIGNSYLTLDKLYFVGGAPGSSSAVVPCVITEICPPIATVAAANPSVQYTLQLDFSLNQTTLPLDLSFALTNGFQVALLCCEFSPMGSVTVGPLSISPNQLSYSVSIGITLSDMILINYALNLLGVQDLHFRVTGSPTYNLFTSIFNNFEYLIDIPASVNLTANGNVPGWFLPLNNAGVNGNGTWNLAASTANSADITIDFPLSYPLPAPLTITNVGIDIIYQGVKVIHAFPTSSGSPVGVFALMPQTTPNNLQVTMRTIVNSSDPNCPTNIPIKWPDRCSLGIFIQNLIARYQTDLTFVITFDGLNGPVTLTLGMEIFRGYWLQTFPRGEMAFVQSQFSIFVYPTSSAFIVNGLGSAESTITSGALNLQLQIKLLNPFAFDFYVNEVGMDAVMDDLDGSHPVVFNSLLTSLVPSLGAITADPLFQKQVVNTGNLFIPRGQNGVHQLVTTPTVTIGVNGGKESIIDVGTRGYDGYLKGFLCMHVLNGYVDLVLQVPGQVGFSFRQPFNVPNISVLGDWDCNGPLSCIPNSGVSISVSSNFATSTWNIQGTSTTTAPTISTTGILTLLRLNQATNSAWFTTRMNVVKSWVVNFSYTETFGGVTGLGCLISALCGASNRGYGFAFVIQDSAANAIGQYAAPVDFTSYTHGFNGIPNSVGVILDMADRHEVVIAQNGDGATKCITAYSTGCVNGIHSRTDLETGRGPWNTDLSGSKSIRILYTAASKLLHVFLVNSNGVANELTYAYIDIAASLHPSSNGYAWMGFVAGSSNDNSYFTQIQMNSFSFGYVSTDVTKSYVVQNNLVITSANMPGSFDIDGKDSCGYDRESGGDTWLVSLNNGPLMYSTIVIDLGTGIYHVTFQPIPMGTYNVMATVNGGSQAIIGTIRIRQAD